MRVFKCSEQRDRPFLCFAGLGQAVIEVDTAERIIHRKYKTDAREPIGAPVDGLACGLEGRPRSWISAAGPSAVGLIRDLRPLSAALFVGPANPLWKRSELFGDNQRHRHTCTPSSIALTASNACRWKRLFDSSDEKSRMHIYEVEPSGFCHGLPGSPTHRLPSRSWSIHSRIFSPDGRVMVKKPCKVFFCNGLQSWATNSRRSDMVGASAATRAFDGDSQPR